MCIPQIEEAGAPISAVAGLCFRWCFAVLCLLLPVPSAPGAPDALETRLTAAIAGIKAIDNHAHPFILTGSGESDPDWDQLSSEVPDFPAPSRLRPGNREIIGAWRALFGYAHDDMEPGHLAELKAARLRIMREQGDRYPEWVLSQIGTETTLANRVTLGRGLNGPRFR